MIRFYALEIIGLSLLIAIRPLASAQNSPAKSDSAKRTVLLTERQKWEALQRSKRLSRQAESYEKRRKFEEAERSAERALLLEEQVRGPWSINVANRLDHVADLYTAHKKASAAEPLYERARAIRERALTTHPDVYERDGGEMRVRRNQPAEKARTSDSPRAPNR